MAEYKEVIKQFKRICKHYRQDVCCSKCPLKEVRGVYHCWRWISEEPEEAEELILQWAKENPEKTNRDIFKDTYGFDISDLFRLGISRDLQSWLEMEYEEPSDDDANG